MDFTSDPFVFHAIVLILTPVFLSIVALLWRNTREVERLNAKYGPTPRTSMSLTPPRRQPSSSLTMSQPTYLDRFTSASPYSKTGVAAGPGKSPLFTADIGSTYSCFGDGLVSRPWLLTPEDNIALDRALN